MRKNIRGFTLIEMVVAIALFSLLVGAMVGVFTYAIRGQRQTHAQQEIVQNGTYLMEYVSRSLRDAKKDLGPTCLTEKSGWTPDQTIPQRGWNYQVFRDATNNCHGTPTLCDLEHKVRFIDRNNKCREFRFFSQNSYDGSTNILEERISSTDAPSGLAWNTPQQLLPDALKFGGEGFSIRVDALGAIEGSYQGDSITPDRKQPRITFLLTLGSKTEPTAPFILQTTITQRTLDIQR